MAEYKAKAGAKIFQLPRVWELLIEKLTLNFLRTFSLDLRRCFLERSPDHPQDQASKATSWLEDERQHQHSGHDR